MRGAVVLISLCAMLLAGCGRGVSQARLENAGHEAASWLSNGRAYDEQRYSPLTQINAKSLDRLGLAWEASLESSDFGVEASPLVADGVLYATSPGAASTPWTRRPAGGCGPSIRRSRATGCGRAAARR